MAKYYGAIGFKESVETSPGVWEDQITERYYYGNLEHNSRRWENSGNQNDDLTISNRLSIIADAYAYQNFHAIVYAQFWSTKWKVNTVEVEHPRLILQIGGEYNGPQAESA
jgi:hypothetical protein